MSKNVPETPTAGTILQPETIQFLHSTQDCQSFLVAQHLVEKRGTGV